MMYGEHALRMRACKNPLVAEATHPPRARPFRVWHQRRSKFHFFSNVLGSACRQEEVQGYSKPWDRRPRDTRPRDMLNPGREEAQGYAKPGREEVQGYAEPWRLLLGGPYD